MRAGHPSFVKWRDLSSSFIGRSFPAVVVALALMLSGHAAAENGAAFISDIEDLPVMPGLNEVPDAGISFDKPSGRIVQAYAEGQVPKTKVFDFYRQTLPQLGWQTDGADRFAREGEALTLTVREMEDGAVIVEFRLSPR